MSLPYRADIPASIDQCVHDLISARADAQPDTPAVCSDDEILTYGQLDTLSSRLATQLVQLGIKSEVIVPICFESSIWAIVAILAVLKAGGAFTPLHPEHSRSYHEGVLKQVRSKVVLVSSQHSTDWQDASQNIIVVDAESLRRLPSGNKTICTPADHKNAAYVLFTVGDSGASDGVVVEHKALSTSCFHYENVFKMTPQARVLHFAPYSTGISIVETFTSLICGACIFLASIDQFDGLIEVIEHFRINWCHLTSTIAQALDPHNVPSLRTLILSQGSMAHQECKKWGNFVELITTYGPVECSSLCYFIAGSENLTSGIIGKPFASVGWVVEQDNPDRLAPQGVVGELLVEGPILARGYLHDPDKTKKAFVNDPLWLVDGFKGHPGRRGRLYRTGDLVRYDSNNNLIYVGRKASQTTFSSQTLELCAIENGLRKHRYIDECVAVSQKHTGGSAGVVCFATILKDFTDVCSKFSRNSDSQEKDIWEEHVEKRLYERLQLQLSSHQMPQSIKILDSIPRKENGKIDRELLEQMTQGSAIKQDSNTSRISEIERVLQRLWAGLFNTSPESISLEDNFFHLGGNLATAMRLVEAAEKEDILLTVDDICQFPKLVSLASLCIANRDCVSKLNGSSRIECLAF
ncbi:Non-ribosomal peptide synthetase NPS1 [Bipolaris sorokiniana ND90Pr]|uniref:Non-ribosomal peptide synthetase NPS1 n=1 Tax=Cochliobolus sativus (strain ND90Pr / ATCC 201652) TaxID=665912 RepID=M2TAV5_COCSN|nr:Non-ribosomal peptide synthetase NPS1 [Bipolaris sorokiniana ND90Pr]EMD66017.1 Non-ribosomal peptide synthetase NPS1 [Bipolaris sorokiniana ND90Pr]